MARLSLDGTKILENYDRFTGAPFNASIVSSWYDGTAMNDSKVDNVIYFKNSVSLGGGYSKRDFEGSAVNLLWFGAVGDSTFDNTSILLAAINKCKQVGYKLLIPTGVFMVRCRTLIVTVEDGETLEVEGEGLRSILKVFDGQITTRASYLFRIYANSGTVSNIVFKNLFIDNNARGSTPPSNPYDFEQSHTFNILSQGSAVLQNITFNNVIINDPAADGFNCATATCNNYRVVNNCAVTNRTRVRSDIQMSIMPQNVFIEGFIGDTIESEAVFTPPGETSFTIIGCLVKKIDIEPGNTCTTIMSDTKVTESTVFSNSKILLSNCKINRGARQEGRWDSMLPGSIVSNCEIILFYNSINNSVVNLDLRPTISPVGIVFDTCNFLIGYPDTFDIPPSGYLIGDGSAMVDTQDFNNNQKSFINCTFDRRARYNFDLYRNGSWKLTDCRFSGSTQCIRFGGGAGYKSKLVIDGGNCENVTGSFIYFVAGTSTHTLILHGTFIGANASNITNGTSTYASNTIQSNRVIMRDSLPVSGIFGDSVMLTTALYGSVKEYFCSNTSVSNAVYVLKNQYRVLKGSTANRPIGLTTKDIGYLYIDTTLSTNGALLVWNGESWIELLPKSPPFIAVSNTTDEVNNVFLNMTYPVEVYPIGTSISYYNLGKEYRRVNAVEWTATTITLIS